MQLLEGIFYVVGLVLGWPLSRFKRWLDRQPHRDPSQISTLQKVGRLALGVTLTVLILVPLGWLIFK